jgi:hypothetical protein
MVLVTIASDSEYTQLLPQLMDAQPLEAQAQEFRNGRLRGTVVQIHLRFMRGPVPFQDIATAAAGNAIFKA